MKHMISVYYIEFSFCWQTYNILVIYSYFGDTLGRKYIFLFFFSLKLSYFVKNCKEMMMNYVERVENKFWWIGSSRILIRSKLVQEMTLDTLLTYVYCVVCTVDILLLIEKTYTNFQLRLHFTLTTNIAWKTKEKKSKVNWPSPVISMHLKWKCSLLRLH